MDTTRERSPNYPQISLEGAVNLVKQIYDTQKRATISLVVVARALSGNERVERLSGPQRSKVAVLRAFGLIDDMASGKVRVSDRALAILQQPTPALFHTALRQAALAPALFAELYEEHRDDSDMALKYYLQTERGFTEDGANRALRTYRETMQYAEMALGSFPSTEGPGLVEPEETSRIASKVSNIPSGREFSGFAAGHDNSDGKVIRMAQMWTLPGGTDAQLTLLGNKPTVAAFDRLLLQITLLRDDLKAEEATPEDEPAADA